MNAKSRVCSAVKRQRLMVMATCFADENSVYCEEVWQIQLSMDRIHNVKD